ncbi:MAG: PPC domain-containing protein [Fimbriiglobus sp.]
MIPSWLSLWVFPLCSLCLCGSFLFAASPTISTIAPRGGQRGTDVTLTFTGGNLADARELLVHSPGFAVKAFTPVNPTTVKATITVAPDCRLGEHGFRVRTATGVSDLRSFWVGALPTLDEKEPNSEFETPQPVPLNTTIHGTIGNEDVDYFVVECKKGDRLAVEIEGLRLGGFWDPYVAILNDKRFELAANDDHPVTAQDGRCGVLVPADGKYTVMVRESAYAGGASYRLHVGTFPVPTAVLPAGGKPGEELEVRFLGDPLGEIRQKVKLPAAADEHFRLHCETPTGVTPTGFRFRVVDLPNVVESGPNVSPQAATVGTAPGAFHGIVGQPGQMKFFKFPATKGLVLDVRVFARRIGSPLDPVLSIHDAKGGQLAANDDAGGPDSHVRFTCPADGEHLVAVRDHLNKGGPDYFFRVELTPVKAEAVFTIPRVDGNNQLGQDRQAIVVPKGNRFASLVAVTRTDFGGGLTVGFAGLPAGVTATADVLDGGQSALPVVFEATPDAAVAGTFTTATATHIDQKHSPVPVRTALEIPLSVDGNTPAYWKIDTDRIAAAVADAAPYRIDVIEPKAPVPQNGSLNLRVVATRADGFKGPITVYPLWTPPGLGIQGSATIAEGQTETVLPMNAAGNAAARKWKTAVLASANAGAGTVWVSSQLFTVEVVPPLVTFAVERSAVEQGKDAAVSCKVTVAAPFDGEATVKLHGLPAKAATADLKLTKTAKELEFKVTTDKATPAGKHGVFCQVLVPVNGETVSQSAGGAEFRVDVPLPPKPAAAAPVAAAKPEPPKPATPPPAAPPKKLSRLEQLRLDQEEREKAGKK